MDTNTTSKIVTMYLKYIFRDDFHCYSSIELTIIEGFRAYPLNGAHNYRSFKVSSSFNINDSLDKQSLLLRYMNGYTTDENCPYQILLGKQYRKIL